MGGEHKRAKAKDGPSGAAPPDKDAPPRRPLGLGSVEAPPLGPGWEALFLEVMRKPVAQGDVESAQLRVLDFQGLLLNIDVPDAAALFARLTRRDDVLGMTFKHTFATPTRRRLLARIESIAVHYEPPAPAVPAPTTASAPPEHEHDLSGLWLLTSEDYEPVSKAGAPTLGMRVLDVSFSHMADVGATTYYDVEFAEPMSAAEVATFLYGDAKPPPFTALDPAGAQPTRRWAIGGPDYSWGVSKHEADARTFFSALRDEVQDALLAQLESDAVQRKYPDWFSQSTRDAVRTTGAPPIGADIKRVPDAALPVYVWREGEIWYRYDTVARDLQAYRREPAGSDFGKQLFNSWAIQYIERGDDITDAMDQTVRDQREANLMMIGGFAIALAGATPLGRPRDIPFSPSYRGKGSVKPPTPDVPVKPPTPDVPVKPPTPDVPVKPPTPDVPIKPPDIPTKAPDAPTKPPDAEPPAPKQPKKPKAEKPPKEAEKPKATRENYKPCFVAGTLVETPGGPVPIESLVAGDLVVARPADAPAFSPVVTAAITSVHAGTTHTLVHLRLRGDELRCTRQHPFRVPFRGWLDASTLAQGDALEGLHTAIALDQVTFTAVEPTPTFNLNVADTATYFVRVGEQPVLVHNGDNPFNRTLYWFFGKKPTVDSAGVKPDVDGMSVWRTENRQQVNDFFETRVKQMNRKVDEPHGFLTPEQLKKADVVAPYTKDPTSPLTEKGLDHHSVRPSANPDPKVPLTPDEMMDLEKRMRELDPPMMKPSQLHGQC